MLCSTLDANTTIINGLGRNANGTKTDLSVFTVQHGKRYVLVEICPCEYEGLIVVTIYSYRFRLISTSCDPAWNFAIDNHTMTIIEADGHSTDPLTVDSLQIYAGQRYSFVVCVCFHRGRPQLI